MITLSLRSFLLSLAALLVLFGAALGLGMRQAARDIESVRRDYGARLDSLAVLVDAAGDSMAATGRRYDSLARKMYKAGLIRKGEIY